MIQAARWRLQHSMPCSARLVACVHVSEDCSIACPLPAPAGGPPEAVNLWIGDERSVTSWHKDPFENIYAGGRALPVENRSRNEHRWAESPQVLCTGAPLQPSPC